MSISGKSKEPAIRVFPASSSPRSAAIPDSRGSIAPRWHTAALIFLILAVATAGTLATRAGGDATPSVAAGSATSARAKIVAVYLPIVLVQWGLAFYVCRVGRARNELRSLVGETWSSAGCALADVGLAALGWLAIGAFELAWRAGAHLIRDGLSRSMSAPASAGASALLPHTTPERLAWVVVAVSVGIAEELVYRGYLQAQLASFTRRPSFATAAQAVLFGIAHLDQGPSTAARFAIYGLAFGVLARWRRSLLPGVLCHVGTDLASGLLLSR